MSTGRPYRRRQLLSNPHAQLRIIAVFGVLALAFAATNWYVAKSSIGSLAGDILQLPSSPAYIHDVTVLLEQHRKTLDWQLTLFTILSFFAIGLGALILSHHIGGPIYQLTRYLEDMTRGKVKPRAIRFRRGDFFHDLAARFNEFQKSRNVLQEPVAGDPPAHVDPPSRPGPE